MAEVHRQIQNQLEEMVRPPGWEGQGQAGRWADRQGQAGRPVRGEGESRLCTMATRPPGDIA